MTGTDMGLKGFLYFNDPHGVFGAESMKLRYLEDGISCSRSQKQNLKYLEALLGPTEGHY